MKARGMFVALILAVAVGMLGGSSVWPGHTAEAQAQAPAAAGTLDTSFGTGGKVTTDFGSGKVTTDFDSRRARAYAVALQSDGKIVAAGDSHNGYNDDFALVRYNADGSLDTTFGTGGKVTTDFGGGGDEANAVALQSDGKIVAAGFSSGDNSPGGHDFALVRYNADGSLDTTFGTGGKVTTDIGGGRDEANFGSGGDEANAVALQSDGKIVAAGFSSGDNSPGGHDFALVRYNADGSLDTAFGTGGKVTTDIGSNSNDYATAMALQSDGKIVAAGYSDGSFAVVRYSADGSLDTFGTGGKAIVAWAMAFQPDGKIVAAGNSFNGYDFALVRYNADGSLDTTFGTGGKVATDIGSGSDDWARAVALQSDGKIVAAGYSDGSFALVRYNADGSLDTAFGTGGKVTTDIGSNSYDEANAVALQSDGKIVAAGYSDGSSALVRYSANGSLDPSFGSPGEVTTDEIGKAVASAMALQPDGKIVAAGHIWNGGYYEWALVRYNPDGSLDTTFGSHGKVTTDFGSNSHVHAVALQSDGKIVTAGSTNYNLLYTSDFSLVRYNADGSLDTTFGTGGKITTDFGSSYEIAYAVALQSDGKIVAAGLSGNDIALVRHNADGSLDTAFGTGGKATTDFGGSDSATAVALQPDGKIVAAGGSSPFGGNKDFALVRHNADGSLDTAFGTGGKATTDFGGSDSATAVALQPDGKIVVAGHGGDNYDFALARYNADGSLDTSFGTGGRVTNDSVWNPNGIAWQSDGKVVTVGGIFNFELFRCNSDGSLDTPFGTGGKVTTDFVPFTSLSETGADSATAVALQSDGKIVAVGYSDGRDFAVARYHGGPQLITDRETLEVFYNATGGDDWTNNTNWLSDKPLGEWHGVTTDAVGRVRTLHLSENNLTGAIPSELGDLSNLQSLELVTNQLSGQIPPELGSLSNLQTLKLWVNQLSGSIPSELGNLSNLTELELSHNQLSGQIPPELGNLSNLQSLQLVMNQLSGSIPSELGSLSNLQSLNLGHNLLTGGILSELGGLPNLRLLYLYSNQLSGEIPPELSSLSNLIHLGLSSNQLSGSIPSELGSLSSLENLGLHSNRLSGGIPSELGSLSNLTELGLGNNQLSEGIPPELGSLSNLTRLYLSYNSALLGPLPGSFTGLDSLTHLLLERTGLCAPTDDAFQTWLGDVEDKRGVANCGDPHILVALYDATSGDNWTDNTNWLSDKPLGEWHGVTTNDDGRVTKLVLGENWLVGTIPAETGGLSALRELHLGGNHLSGQIPTELGGLSALARLNLEDNDLSEPIPEELGGLSELTHLLLGGNNLSGSLPAELGDLGKLTRLGVGDNDLIGPIPAELGGLGKLELLDLHRNDLSGRVPPELGGLTKLERLYAHDNDLTGEIPASLVDLAELEVLDLHRNQLSGCVPGGLVHPGLDLRTDLSCIDYDSDDDGLIEVSTLAQLDAIRWDLDGDGFAGDAGYAAAFPNADSGAVKDYSELIAKVREWRNDPALVDNKEHTDRWDRVLLALGETVADTSLTPMTAAEAQGYADRGWQRWVEAVKALREIEGAGMGCPSTGCAGYELTRDLDFDTDSSGRADAGDAYWNGGAGWTPIGLGDDDGFDGVFEGNGHAIRNLYVKTTGDRAGLFSLLAAGSEVRNVGLESVNVSGRGEVGGLVGLSNGTVSSIHVTGTVSGRNAVGGLVGVSGGTGVIEGSYAAADVTGATPRSSGGRDVGGLVGVNYGAVRASYATGAVSGKANNTGGLAGLSEGGSSIVASYAASTVSTSGRYAGGLVGSSWGDITGSYSSGKVSAGGGNAGGLVGYRGRGTVTSSYWDTQTSGQAGSPAGQGKTTAQLKQPTGYTGIYADWNVDIDGDGSADDPWDFGTASEYPMLK